MAKILVVVESPAKARTISRYLGSDFVVESSIGHIRDLPSTAAEIPSRLKGKPWARLGVDVDSDFRPIYVIPRAKSKQVHKLKEQLASASELYLATDEDREGEAIAWHLAEVLKPSCPVKRMVFHEITRAAIERAIDDPRDIDIRLVNAQEARRILDRLVGYEVSPLLWRKIRPKLSAGRVQSVAVRLVVDRERARMAFVAASFGRVEATLRPRRGDASFTARLTELDGHRVATSKDFDATTGAVKGRNVQVLDLDSARRVGSELESAPLAVTEVVDKPFTTRPYAPFMTSTLQQEAGRKLRFSAQRTMRVAQSLYENGYITYMRTDSVTLSGEAIGAARSQVERLYGHEYLPDRPRHYTSKARNAQEAHEAIRPAGDSFRTPQELRGALETDQLRLYELIWKRTLASQMKDAQGMRSTVRIEGETGTAGTAVLAANGKVLTFAGFLRAYVEGSDDPTAELADQEKVLPKLARGDELEALDVVASESTTQPQARHTEATLVKELEARGIGRPSTYATIIQTIQDRGYVWHKGPALVPSFTAFAVTQLLERHLPELVDYDFTARMEDELDRIATGERESVPWLHEFYFGPEDGNGGDSRLASAGLQAMLSDSVESAAPQEVSRIELPGELDGSRLVVRVGRYGPYLEIGDDPERRVSVPPDLPPDELTPAKVRELAEQVEGGARELGTDPESGQPVYLKSGRFGPYVQLGDANGNGAAKGKGRSKGAAKPRMASLWPEMSPDNLDLEQALMLLSYPREVGTHPETGALITAHFGRYGPFLKMGDDNRSLDSYATLADITLEGAVEVFKQPKARRRSGSPSVLAELGQHPGSGADVQVKDGRWGPYVTDGTVNATIPKGTDPASVTLDQAVELLAARERKMREKGQKPGARPGGRRKAPAKKK